MITLQSPAGDGGAPEDHVVEEIKTFLGINGWLVQVFDQKIQHVDGCGTPDMFAGKRGRALWIEAKSRPGPWTTRTGGKRTIPEGKPRRSQERFFLKWSGDIPCIIARSWRDVANELVKLGWD